MLTKLAALVVAFAASTASAASMDPISRTKDDAARIWYHDAELRIAELDLTTARREIAMTQGYWDQAVAANHPDAAGYWAQRHFRALQVANEASGRVMLHRAEHDIARDDFERDANWVRAEARLSTRKRG